MKYLFLLLLSCILIRCTNTTTAPKVYHLEDYRREGMTDYEAFANMYDSLPDSCSVQFDKPFYVLDHTIIVSKKINFLGTSTIKRADQITYTLKDSAKIPDNYLVLNSTQGLIAHDKVFFAWGTLGSEATAADFIKSISNDTVYLEHGFKQPFAAGSKLYKNLVLFWIENKFSFPETGCTFTNITFDGNRDNNTATHYWNANACIVAVNKAYTAYLNCTFVNSPNETILGHNARISYCHFKNLNGSAFHASIDRTLVPEDQIHSYITNSTFENTNQVKNGITGHSEGCITHSNSGGYYTATGNTFTNVGEALIGILYPSVSIHDWGTSNITFSNNTINSAKSRMVFGIATIPGKLENIKIEKNKVVNISAYDYSQGLEFWKGIILEQK